jgi:hypothetical protein
LVDEAPDAGIERWIAAPAAVPDQRNAAIFLAGIDAPVGDDPIARGRFVVDTLAAGRYSAHWSATQERLKAPGTLKPSLDSHALTCWLEPALTRTGKCASDAEVRAMVREDAELLWRYERAVALSEFQGGLHNGVLFLDVNRARLVRNRLDLRDGRPVAALARWRANQEFLERALRSEGSWVDKAILLVAQSFSLQALEEILQQRFALGAADYEALERLLRPAGIAAYDVDGALRAEYAMLRPIFTPPARLQFWVHPQFIENRFARFSAAFADAARAPLPDLEDAFDRVRRSQLEDRADYLRDPMNTYFVRGLLRGQIKVGEMLRQMHIHEGRKALLALRLEVRRGGMADAQIPALLAASTLRDPHGQAMRWDAARRSIWYALPGGEGERYEVRL